MSNNETVLTASGINKWFNEPTSFHVLKELSFEVNRGEFVSLVGKSGSGKSTLLYVLSTMDTDFGGQLIINQEDLTAKSHNELAAFCNIHIAFAFQFNSFLPDITPLDNFLLPPLKLVSNSS